MSVERHSFGGKMMDLLSSISAKFTKEELIEALKRLGGCEDVLIKEIEIETSIEMETKGDSYLSSIYRFTVKGRGFMRKRKELICFHIIAKGFPKNKARVKTFRAPDFFGNEIYFYNNVWPVMKDFKASKNIKEPDEVPLILSSCSDGENDYLALKDIKFEGYETVKRDLGITKEYASSFLKLLADFHALSIAAKDQNPEFEQIARSLNETYFHEKYRTWYSNFLNDKLFNVIRRAVKNHSDSPKYIKKLDELFAKDYYGRLCMLANDYSGKLLGVAQGDTSLPNLMVKIVDNKPQHAILVDYQLARYSSVTGDLIQFLYTCVDQEVLVNHWDDLVKEYHKYLSDRIYLLGSAPDLITLDDLREDIQRHPHVGLAMAMEATVISLLYEDELPDLDTLEGNEALPLETVWNICPFDDASRTKKVAFLIKHAVDRGFI